MFENQGKQVSKQVETATQVFNGGMRKTVVPGLQRLGGYVGLFDTAPVFNVSASGSRYSS